MINFKNGQLNLKNGEFKSREKSDYVSRSLNYNYEISEDENIKSKVELILKRICNCDETLYSFALKWLAYCITGETNLQKFLLLLGLAGNGKSTLLEIMEIVFPIYVSKLDHKTFNERYEKAYNRFSHASHSRQRATANSHTKRSSGYKILDLHTLKNLKQKN
jgi:hypothetical protein